MLKLSAVLLLASTLAVTAHAAAPQGDYSEYVGRYALADGRVLTIADEGGTLTAQIAKRSATMRNARFSESRTVELKPAGLARFAATASPLQITFGADGKGEIAQVSLTERGDALQGVAER